MILDSNTSNTIEWARFQRTEDVGQGAVPRFLVAECREVIGARHFKVYGWFDFDKETEL